MEKSFSDLDLDRKAKVIAEQLHVIACRGDFRKVFNGGNPYFYSEVKENGISVSPLIVKDVVLSPRMSSKEMLVDLEQHIWDSVNKFNIKEYVGEQLKSCPEDKEVKDIIEDGQNKGKELFNFALAFSGAVNNNRERLEQIEAHALGKGPRPYESLATNHPKQMWELDHLHLKSYELSEFNGIETPVELKSKISDDFDSILDAPTFFSLSNGLDWQFDRQDELKNEENWELLLASAEQSINDDYDSFKKESVKFSTEDILNKGFDALYYCAFEQNQALLQYNSVVKIIHNDLTEKQQIELLQSLSPDESLDHFVQDFVANYSSEFDKEQVIDDLLEEINKRSGPDNSLSEKQEISSFNKI